MSADTSGDWIEYSLKHSRPHEYQVNNSLDESLGESIGDSSLDELLDQQNNNSLNTRNLPNNYNRFQSDDIVLEQDPPIEDIPIEDGPIEDIIPLQVTGCTAGNFDTYNTVEYAIECAIGSEGTNVGPLGKSVLLGEIASQPPISCMIDLITGPNSNCNTKIPSDRREAAFDAFRQVTNFTPVNVGGVFSEITDSQRNILNLTAFYIFFPTFLFVLVAIWLMVGFTWLTWPAGLFLSVLAFIILYGFALLYRTQVYSFLISQNQDWQNNASSFQANYQDSIAYWPQGLFAAACAVGGTGWICNEINTTSKDVLNKRGCSTCNLNKPIKKSLRKRKGIKADE